MLQKKRLLIQPIDAKGKVLPALFKEKGVLAQLIEMVWNFTRNVCTGIVFIYLVYYFLT